MKPVIKAGGECVKTKNALRGSRVQISARPALFSTSNGG
jgi:hypothetical protein